MNFASRMQLLRKLQFRGTGCLRGMSRILIWSVLPSRAIPSEQNQSLTKNLAFVLKVDNRIKTFDFKRVRFGKNRIVDLGNGERGVWNLKENKDSSMLEMEFDLKQDGSEYILYQVHFWEEGLNSSHVFWRHIDNVLFSLQLGQDRTREISKRGCSFSGGWRHILGQRLAVSME